MVVVIFILFNVLPADPARMMLGQRADSASVAIINRDIGLDQPMTVRFAMYVNDLSPISIHNVANEQSHFYLDNTKYRHYIKLFTVAQKVVVLKVPYLRRSYQNKRNVGDILAEKIPDTLPCLPSPPSSSPPFSAHRARHRGRVKKGLVDGSHHDGVLYRRTFRFPVILRLSIAFSLGYSALSSAATPTST